MAVRPKVGDTVLVTYSLSSGWIVGMKNVKIVIDDVQRIGVDLGRECLWTHNLNGFLPRNTGYWLYRRINEYEVVHETEEEDTWL